jgi:hypothetical protein
MSTKSRALQLNKGILCPLFELINASIDEGLSSFDKFLSSKNSLKPALRECFSLGGGVNPRHYSVSALFDNLTLIKKTGVLIHDQY